MKIVRESLAEGAKRAKGLVIVIDVFRAFTFTPLLFHYGAKKVIFVDTPEAAFEVKSRYSDVLLAGEINEQLIPGFDLGNSPAELVGSVRESLEGKVVVQRTTAGVSGVLKAVYNAETVILGSYVMARAIAGYILSRKPAPSIVTIVAMGSRGMIPSHEDEGCADYLEHLLRGRSYNHIEALQRIVFNDTAQKFIRGDKEYLPREDPVFCLQRDIFNFVLIAGREDGLVTVRRENISL